PVAALQAAGDAVLDVAVSRLAQDVAAEHRARLDVARLEPANERLARDAVTNRHRVAEPGRLGSRVGHWQDQPVGELLQPVVEHPEVAASRLDEAGEALQLGGADRRLQVGGLQVEPDVRIHELVVVPGREVAELPAEPPPAGVALAGSAPAVSAPVANRAHDPRVARMVDEHGTALA